MASFEGMRSGTAGAILGWRVTRYLPLYLAGIAAGAGMGIGLTFLADGHETRVVTRGEAPAAPVVQTQAPEAPVVTFPAVFAADLPADFTVSFQFPMPQPEPAPLLETAPAAPVAPAEPSAPAAANPPAATKPIEQSKPAPPPPAPAETPNFYLPVVSGSGITNLEQRLLDGINAERAANGLAPYTYDASLSKVARTRSQQMTDQGYFGHVDPYGYSMYTELLQKFGIGYAWAGENLALNNYNVGESPERAVISLMKSPTHAANILAGDFFRIGIGEVTTSDGRHIYAMIFVG